MKVTKESIATVHGRQLSHRATVIFEIAILNIVEVVLSIYLDIQKYYQQPKAMIGESKLICTSINFQIIILFRKEVDEYCKDNNSYHKIIEIN